MKSCSSSLLWVLIAVFTPGGESALHPVTVKLHDSAVLPCSGRCSGVVRWTVFHKPRDILAECNQTSCRSVKEGYQMIYNQYLQGDFSLNISEADFSKRARYTCECDGKHECDVVLKIEALKTPVQVKPGGSLLLDLDVSEPMEVIYNRTSEADGSSGQTICMVDGRSVQCKPEYTQKASLLSALELRDMKESDSGVYTVRDSKNEETIHIYTVTVRDGGDGSGAVCEEDKLRQFNCYSPTHECSAAGVPVWMVVVVAVVATLATMVIVLAVVLIVLKRENQQLQTTLEKNDHKQNRFLKNIPVSVQEEEWCARMNGGGYAGSYTSCDCGRISSNYEAKERELVALYQTTK